jgi:hypothetical protein
LKFIPVSVRKDGLTLYNTGYFYNETYNDVDISEMIKVGIEIRNIHYAMVFNNSIPNILSEYITIINQERGKVKDTNTVLGDAYKLMGNSIYGKTVCRDIEDCFVFTT